MGGRTGPSLWIEAPEPPLPRLEGDLSADVAVIGAGYTGLSTALELRRQGIDVVVLESAYPGFGASGRNAGHLTPTIGKDLPSLLRGFGRERGGALVRLADSAVEHVEATIAELGIDCDYRAAGNVVAGVHPGQGARLERACRAGIELGAALRMLEPPELRERGIPTAFCCGYLERRGGVLDPGRYLAGLRDATIEAGARVLGRSAAEAIEVDGRAVRVRTAAGEVSAERAVIATNAYTRQLGVPAGGPVPIGVSLLATVPLPAEVRERIGWPGEEGIYTAHEVLESHRLTADGRIVSGSRYVRYGRGGAIPPDRDPQVFAAIERVVRERFPELEGVAIERFWSGPIAFNLNFLPWVGSSERGRVAWAVGFAGHGVALATLAGRWLARLARGEPSGVPELTGARRLPMPPEPLRGLVARGLIRTLEWVDARTDRRISAE